MSTIVQLHSNYQLREITPWTKNEDLNVASTIPAEKVVLIPRGKTALIKFRNTLEDIAGQIFSLRVSDWRIRDSQPFPKATVDQFTAGSDIFNVKPILVDSFTGKHVPLEGFPLRAFLLPSYEPVEIGKLWVEKDHNLQKVLPDHLRDLLPRLIHLSEDPAIVERVKFRSANSIPVSREI